MQLLLPYPYKLYPYERRFLRAEIESLGGVVRAANGRGLTVEGMTIERARHLTYVRELRSQNPEGIVTIQGLKEGGPSRQVTSYGPHGLHDYRGKFNPQTPRSLLIQQRLKPGDVVLDPFCGSGTTLIEACLLGQSAIGFELHPLAAFVSRAKLAWMHMPAVEAPTRQQIESCEPVSYSANDLTYLAKWFPEPRLEEIRKSVSWSRDQPSNDSQVALAVLSNQLRDHSFQDPRDLRIRRRTEVPQGSFTSDFAQALRATWAARRAWASMNFGKDGAQVSIVLESSTNLHRHVDIGSIAGTVTSPPYATALPYADTYRLSNVVLQLVPAKHLGPLDQSLAGSRDISAADRSIFQARLDALPERVTDFIIELSRNIASDESAGFRRKAVPYALARYLDIMRQVFEALFQAERPGAANSWVVGPNRTTVRGESVQIDTPHLLAELATAAGFDAVRNTPMETYSRYDLHSANSIRSESFLSFVK